MKWSHDYFWLQPVEPERFWSNDSFAGHVGDSSTGMGDWEYSGSAGHASIASELGLVFIVQVFMILAASLISKWRLDRASVVENEVSGSHVGKIIEIIEIHRKLNLGAFFASIFLILWMLSTRLNNVAALFEMQLNHYGLVHFSSCKTEFVLQNGVRHVKWRQQITE